MTPSSNNRPLLVEAPIRVNGYDIDLAGIVNNTVFVRWLEDMRMAWCYAHLPMTQQTVDGFLPMIISTHIEYKRPVRFLDEVLGRVWIADLGRVRWTVEHEIVCNGEIAAKATQVGVFADVRSRKPIGIPALLAEKYRTALADQATPDANSITL